MYSRHKALIREIKKARQHVPAGNKGWGFLTGKTLTDKSNDLL